ncbi:MAG: 3',5'-cyclic-nucleotide phosphodiesterase [Candidatus Fermentibacteraceae bacterium]|nr:3',5'-cyclic-nucleotide phosphodiesterase [Candidatus Fermentibacteraceae bacterium]MBN2608777.1 3',5'-cyclic-nucleotide phosphodiesterase [Candidatus Fermentibacteraceae bacterium]
MQLDIIGVDGSKQYGCYLCSMLLGESVLLDAGSASMLSGSQQQNVEMVLLTHAHLDHVLELGFMIDATVTIRDEPLRVMGSRACLEIVRKHYMNDLIWPDFSRIKTSSGPTLVYQDIQDRKWFDLPGGLSAWAEPVCHGAGARGFIFRSGTGSIIHTGDTGPTSSIWKKAAQIEDLKMILAEISFPDSKTDVAIASNHLTPALLEAELGKLGRSDVPVYVFHLKPWERHEIERDVARRFSDRVVILRRGDRLEF